MAVTKWYAIPPSLKMSDAEYRANLDGMNIVFGAVLGFVLASANGLPAKDFAILLLASASAVVSILYLSSSPYKLFYAVTTIGLVGLLPWILDRLIDGPAIPQLRPTLAVWTGMVLLVELIPRHKSESKAETKEPLE